MSRRFIFTSALPIPQYSSVYPPAQNSTYVIASGNTVSQNQPYHATDPSKSLVGSSISTAWISGNPTGPTTNMRFHIDLGSGYTIKRLYFENYHSSGYEPGTYAGVSGFTLQGSNTSSAFSNLNWATNTNWTTIHNGTFLKHTGADQSEPQYIVVTNTTSYRYYAIKCNGNWNSTGGSQNYMGIRRIELQVKNW